MTNSEEAGKTILVFVYGTLKPGHSNFHVAQPVQGCSRDSVKGDLYSLPGLDYPGLINLDQSTNQVEGFVLRVAASKLADLDRLEDYDAATDSGDYYRRSVKTKTGLQAYIYVYNDQNKLGEKISSWRPELDQPALCGSNSEKTTQNKP